MSGLNVFCAFLAGFTDVEGCISISSKGMAFYTLGNYNRRLLSQIRCKMAEFGVYCTKLAESKIRGININTGAKHNQNYWHFSIHRKISLLALFNLIGPYLRHQKRIDGMKRAKLNIELRNAKYGNINMAK